MVEERVVAIIPARGGSKGIPHKNILPLAGRPLVAWSIGHASNSKLVDAVYVSTDDDAIARASEEWGAEVIRRPAEIAGDTASSESAVLHALEEIEKAGGPVDLVVFLQATSPIRAKDDIDRAIAVLREEQADSCFSACAEHFTGRWRIQPDGEAAPVNFALGKRPMRQQYPIEYLENGSIYVFKPWVLRDTGARLGGKIAIYPMGALESQQIDSREEALRIERIMRSERCPSDENILNLLRPVRLLVLDFDGVMTDNRVLVDDEGREAVFCNRGDGWGLARLRDAKFETLVLSTERNPVVAARCRKLRMDCVQGSDDKLRALKEMASQRSLHPDEIAYVGNDVNDQACMEWVGVPIAPADATGAILAIARIVTPQKGGAGVVRQVADWILDAQIKGKDI